MTYEKPTVSLVGNAVAVVAATDKESGVNLDNIAPPYTFTTSAYEADE